MDALCRSPVTTMNPNTACAAGTGNIAGFAPAPFRFEISKERSLRWYGTCSDIHDSKLLEQSIRDSAIELERMVDDRTAALRRLSGRLITMQDDERRRIARELHDGLGQELVAIKMMMDGILQECALAERESG